MLLTRPPLSNNGASKSDKSSTNQFILDDSELARFKTFKLSGFANISVADDRFKEYFQTNEIQDKSEKKSNNIVAQTNPLPLNNPAESFKPENEKEFYDYKEKIVDNSDDSDYAEEVRNDYIQESYPRLNISDYYIKLFNNSFIRSFIPKDIDISVEDYRTFTKIMGGAILYNKDNFITSSLVWETTPSLPFCVARTARQSTIATTHPTLPKAWTTTHSQP